MSGWAARVSPRRRGSRCRCSGAENGSGPGAPARVGGSSARDGFAAPDARAPQVGRSEAVRCKVCAEQWLQNVFASQAAMHLAPVCRTHTPDMRIVAVRTKTRPALRRTNVATETTQLLAARLAVSDPWSSSRIGPYDICRTLLSTLSKRKQLTNDLVAVKFDLPVAASISSLNSLP
jgi:hypothetical protein